MPVRVAVGIRKQFVSLISRLVVIESLIVRKCFGRIENMNHCSHIFMYQADQLEISGSRENYSKSLSRYYWGNSHAGRTIVGGRIGRKARTPVSKKWARLVGS